MYDMVSGNIDKKQGVTIVKKPSNINTITSNQILDWSEEIISWEK